ncbi:uncharacterized protein B0I36DRAFT_323701 [Microdochium trichocladiopsis]|uniref:Uncharacterized protein n=1 Tax=Microdochium trichocladiopsis TaxID=1682393 RepID=A0A9P8Y6Q6_9PEZI|nr:uncharacterized protein B0I36DRAFT_323701 [Microdochium trichocladiopsis]KAH7031331.1 hypothetical protein B0I36DRAFT_323701 [Microdochium trichocladiopsis]
MHASFWLCRSIDRPITSAQSRRPPKPITASHSVHGVYVLTRASIARQRLLFLASPAGYQGSLVPRSHSTIHVARGRRIPCLPAQAGQSSRTPTASLLLRALVLVYNGTPLRNGVGIVENSVKHGWSSNTAYNIIAGLTIANTRESRCMENPSYDDSPCSGCSDHRLVCDKELRRR